MTDADDQAPTAHFPIRTVVAETGVNAITLRAWERRYGLIKPVRTEGGHRLYSQADIELVRRVMLLQDRGIPVSRAIAWIRQHPDATDLPEAARDGGRLTAPPAGQSSWAALRERMLEAAGRYDDFDLETAWNDAVEQYPVDVVLGFLLVPVAGMLRDRIDQDPEGRARHHFFLSFLRNKLGARYANQSRNAQGTRVVLLAATGTQADITLLLTGIALAQQGLRPLLFAGGLPPADLPAMLRRSRARAVVVAADEPCAAAIHDITGIAREGLPVFAGGDALRAQGDVMRAAGAILLDADAGAAARLIRDVLSPPVHATPGS